MKNINKKINYFKHFCLIIGLFLLISNIIRAKNTGLTYDESFTYLNYIYKNPFLCFKYLFSPGAWANNHLLNSFFISCIELIIPIKYNELIIRTPNLLFYIFYLYFSYRLSLKYKNKYTCFLLLVCNYGVHEFFGLARGYGLACALVLISCYYLVKYTENIKTYKYLNLSYFFALLACYANTVSLICYATILILSFIHLLVNKEIFTYIKKNIIYLFLIIGLTLSIINYHFLVSSDGLPLYGSNETFYNSVFISIFKTFGFNNWSNYFAIATIIIILLILIFNFKKVLKNYIIHLTLVYFLILITLTLITKQMWLTGRCLIPAFPFFAISFIEMLELVEFKKKAWGGLSCSIMIIFICCVNFILNLNFNEVREWKSDYIIKIVAYDAYKNKDNKKLKKYENNYAIRFYREKILYYYNYDILKK